MRFIFRIACASPDFNRANLAFFDELVILGLFAADDVASGLNRNEAVWSRDVWHYGNLQDFSETSNPHRQIKTGGYRLNPVLPPASCRPVDLT
jgi:hypothetical protein